MMTWRLPGGATPPPNPLMFGEASTAARSTRPSAAPMSSEPPVLGDGPLVMVDDDALDLRLARRSHARSGIERPLTTFDDPRALLAHLDAVARGQAPWPALLLIDIRMPGVDGFEVVRRVRARAAFAEAPPIAMLSTSTLEQDRREAAALGCAAYLVKPSSTKAFIALFRAMGP